MTETTTRVIDAEDTRIILLSYNIRLTEQALLRASQARNGPPAAEERNGEYFYDEEAVRQWAEDQDTGHGFYENHLDELAHKKPLWALVSEIGPETNYLAEQLKEFGCDVIRLNPATALEYAESCFDAALFTLDPEQLELMIPAVAVMTDRGVPCVVIKNRVTGFPEFPENEVLALDAIDTFYDRMQQRSDVLAERMRFNRRLPIPILPKGSYLVSPRGRS